MSVMWVGCCGSRVQLDLEQLPVRFLVSSSNALFLQDAAEKRTVIMNRKAMRKLQLLDHSTGGTAAVREPASTRKPTAARETAVAFT